MYLLCLECVSKKPLAFSTLYNDNTFNKHQALHQSVETKKQKQAFLTVKPRMLKSPTCSGQSLVGLVTEDLRQPGSLGIDGLLHGLHPHSQVVILRLQHGVLMDQVVDALHAVLTHQTLPLDDEKQS